MSVTPEIIAVALGVAAPQPDSPQALQWSMWIQDAEMLIETRRLSVDADMAIDQAKLDYVVREAVAAHVRNPDDATQVTDAVDDGSSTRMYRSGKGRVTILDEWWALLGLIPAPSGAFSIIPAGRRGGSGHMPWCDLFMGGSSCSCGASLTRHEYPLWEGGILSPDPEWWI